jgi:WD40 repeat protein
MEKKITPSEAAPIIYKFEPNEIPRCPECNLVPAIKLFYKEELPYINYECENNHNGNLLLEDYIKKYNNYSIYKEKCEECKKNQNEVKGNFVYCSKCFKFLCYSCSITHLNNDHELINIKRYDCLCKKHSYLYDSYCLQCHKNLCTYCLKEHKFHNCVNLFVLDYSEESMKNLEEEMNNLEKKINNLDIIKEKIISQIENLKKSTELEIKLIKILLSTYQYELNYHNLNFNFIQNLKNFEIIFKSNKLDIFEKTYDEGEKYISLINSLLNIKQNTFKNNFKTINYHSDRIRHLLQLNDGRLASSSNDNSLNIYKLNTFELQISIKEHSDCIFSFNQLKDGRIITCSKDKTIKVIKLIGEESYKIQQTLKGHTNLIMKVIEIKQKELVSVSMDKTMKIWKENNNKFINIKSIDFQNSEDSYNILNLNENQFVTSSVEEKNIKFWSTENYSLIKTIDDIETDYQPQSMCLIKTDILCIGTCNSKGFF